MPDAEAFYDSLVDDYGCLFDDWWSAATWHGSVVARLLAAEGVQPPSALLDVTCGIGTQALPLAAMGYQVTGTDLSAAAVERASMEARVRDVRLRLEVADVRRVRDTVGGTFDAVISCDNALPHLLTDDDLARGLASVRACLSPGGLFLASIRDYDGLVESRPDGVPVAVHGPHGRRHASGQAWQWAEDGEHVDITLFTLVELDGQWRAQSHETTYRALRRQTMTQALAAARFEQVRWLMPAESGYYQPVVLARAAGR